MRFPRLTAAQWSKDQREVAAEIMAGPRGELRGPFVPLIYSPELAARVQRLGEYVRFGTELGNDLVELAVLHVARHFDCANIWESHSRLAAKAGVAREIIAAISERRPPAGLSADQDIVVALSGELLATNRLSPELFERARARFGHRGVMDLTGIVGYYTMLAMVLNVAEPPLASGSVPFES